MKKDIIEKFNENEYIRLNKFLSDAGVCSRREGDRLIEEGKIFVNGERAITGMKILPQWDIEYNGKKVKREDEFIIIALNKPRGIECTSDLNTPDNIIDFIGMKKRVYPVGRLDKDSEGLILLTNNGAIVNKIMKASNNHEKEYIVKVNKIITESFIKDMSNGVHLKEYRSGKLILDETTRKCKVKKIDDKTFSIILTQGLNRQIRRMTKELGYKVLELKRVRIMNIQLGDLKSGEYRNISEVEIIGLKKLLDQVKNG